MQENILADALAEAIAHAYKLHDALLAAQAEHNKIGSNVDALVAHMGIAADHTEAMSGVLVDVAPELQRLSDAALHIPASDTANAARPHLRAVK